MNHAISSLTVFTSDGVVNNNLFCWAG